VVKSSIIEELVNTKTAIKQGIHFFFDVNPRNLIKNFVVSFASTYFIATSWIEIVTLVSFAFSVLRFFQSQKALQVLLSVTDFKL